MLQGDTIAGGLLVEIKRNCGGDMFYLRMVAECLWQFEIFCFKRSLR